MVPFLSVVVTLVLLGGGAGAAFAAGPGVQPPPEIATGHQSGVTVRKDKDMAVTANPHASEAAANILARGGSAVDAVIAAQMVLNLVEPQSSGIGGGGFLLVHDERTRRLRVFDGRETSPAAVDQNLFLGSNSKPLKFFDAVDSGLSVGVPGLLRMLDLAHRGHGRLPWGELFRPAIALATDGFIVSERLAQSIKSALPRIKRSPSAAAYFLTKAGRPLKAGTVLKNPALAKTFQEIADHGADRFYNGSIAASIVKAVHEHPVRPGVLQIEDLAGYRALEREPLCGEYRRFRVCGMPAPSSGAITTLQTLGALESFDLSVLAPDSAKAMHLITESQRLAYADRARYISDPEFAPVPVAGLLDREYLRERARLINPDKSIGVARPGLPEGAVDAGIDKTTPLPSTTHLSIVDQSGNAVSMTSSIEHAFGSLIQVDGFLLNNQLTDFSFVSTDKEGRPVKNRVEAGKRPRSSMAPTMVFDWRGNLEAVLGSPGGSSIIQYVTQTIIGLVDWKLAPYEAVSAPHFGAKTSARTTLEADTAIVSRQQEMIALGHKIRVVPQTSGLHLIVFNGVRPDGQTGMLAAGMERSRWAGAADPRREGAVSGR